MQYLPSTDPLSNSRDCDVRKHRIFGKPVEVE
jgi:hypothetical protein